MTKEIRFVHCGGFQFDSRSWKGPEKWMSLHNQDLWQAFESVLKLCRSEKIDCLFLTGNLFEQDYVHKKTIDQIVKAFGNLEETRIFITPGKMDPLVSTSAYRLALWPHNVHIFSKGISSIKIPALNLTVYGAGWTAYRQEPFLTDFHITEDETYHLMLLHATVDLNENLNKTNRLLTPAEIAASGLDYLALGYQEEWSGLQQARETFWADSGFPQAQSFPGNSPHGIIMGKINEKNSSQFEFHKLEQRCYVEKIYSAQNQTDLEKLAVKFLEETNSYEKQNDLFRIKLSDFNNEEEAAVQINLLQKILKDKIKYLDIIPLAEENLPKFKKSGSTLKKQTDEREIKDGFLTLQQMIKHRLLQDHPRTTKHNKESNYWELIQKIGWAAFEQGRIDDEN